MKVVVFEIRNCRYALPADSIRQIAEVLPVTPVPFVPAYVEGLTATGGAVLPQIDLAARLGVDQGGNGELIVVSSGGSEVVLRVGRTRRMLELAESDLVPVGEEGTEDDDETGEDSWEPESSLVAAEFQMDGEPVLLLKPEAVGIDGLAPGIIAGNGAGGALLGDEGGVVSSKAVDHDMLACLVVAVGCERYAFPLDAVFEVYADSGLTPIPNAPGFVGGISVLRGSPRLVVSLSRLLGLRPSGGEAQMVASQVRGMPMVFQCDSLVGIRRYSGNRRENAGDRTGCVDSFLIGDDGSVTGLLALDNLIADADMERLRPFLLNHRASDTRTVVREETRRMLLVGAGAETCAIDIASVERVTQYVPPVEVPGAGGLMAGMVEVGGRILPAADLGIAFGEPGKSAAYVVVRTGREDGFDAWALAVGRLERLTDVPVGTIRPTSNSADEIVAAIGRVGNRLISIIEPDRLEAVFDMHGMDGVSEAVA